MTTKLYEADFSQWATQQAALLRSEDYGDLDVENLIDELEAMAARDRRELTRRLGRIAEHFLKLSCEPNSDAVNNWKTTITNQRAELWLLLKENATLRSRTEDFMPDAYHLGLRFADGKMKCKAEEFPERCPWTSEQLLDPNFWP